MLRGSRPVHGVDSNRLPSAPGGGSSMTTRTSETVRTGRGLMQHTALNIPYPPLTGADGVQWTLAQRMAQPSSSAGASLPVGKGWCRPSPAATPAVPQDRTSAMPDVSLLPVPVSTVTHIICGICVLLVVCVSCAICVTHVTDVAHVHFPYMLHHSHMLDISHMSDLSHLPQVFHLL